jgi:ATP-dependent Clp protease ATP-binding subunit ClpX
LYKASGPELVKALQKYGIIPELIGRIPVIARFKALGRAELARILIEGEESPIKSYKKDFEAFGIECNFTNDAYGTISKLAYERGMGARGLKSVIEESLAPFKFYLPGTSVKKITISSKAILEPEKTVLALLESLNKYDGGENGETKS